MHSAGTPANITPDEKIEGTELFREREHPARVPDGRFNLQAIAHDAGVRSRRLNILRRISLRSLRIKAVQGLAVVLAFLRMVSQLRPACAPSRTRNSKGRDRYARAFPIRGRGTSRTVDRCRTMRIYLSCFSDPALAITGSGPRSLKSTNTHAAPPSSSLAAMAHQDTQGDIRRDIEQKNANLEKRHACVMDAVDGVRRQAKPPMAGSRSIQSCASTNA